MGLQPKSGSERHQCDDSCRTFPASYIQRSIWLDEQLHPGTVAHNVTHAVALSEPFDVDHLRRSLQDVVDHNDMLRATMLDVDGVPHQTVHAGVAVDFRVESADGWDGRQLAQRIAVEARTTFDLTAGPLMRCLLLSRAPDDHVLVFALHHVITDMWSMALLGRAAAAAYRAEAADNKPDRPPRSSYHDFVRAERAFVDGEKGQAALRYWMALLDDVGDLPPVPLARASSAPRRGRGGCESFVLDVDRTERLRALAKSAGVSLDLVVLAVVQAVLHRYTDHDDVLVSSLHANRSARTARVMGCFLNPELVHGDLSGDPSFVELLSRLDGFRRESADHRALPLQRLVEATHSVAGGLPPPVQAVFSWQKTTRAIDTDLTAALAVGADGPHVDIDGFRVEAVAAAHRSAPFPLSLLAAEIDDEIHLAIDYDTDVYEQPAMARMADHVQVMIDAVLTDPGQRLSDIELLTPAERNVFESQWSHVERAHPVTTVHGLVQRQAARRGNTPAVVFGGRVVTYGELDATSNRLARHLRAAGVVAGDLVGIHLGRSVEMVEAILAVMKCGAGFVPLDPGFPSDRLEFMVEDSDVALVVGSATATTSVSISGRARYLALDADADEIAEQSPSSLDVDGGAESVAYVMYTSGSTGTPKGVVVGHGNLVNLLSAMAIRPGFVETDVMLSVTTLSFDISLLELLLPLSVGGRVVIAPSTAVVNPVALAELLVDSRATVMQATPATWRMMVEAGWDGDSDLKVLCGGEAVARDLADALLDRCGSMWNMYGPTETTVWSAVSAVSAGSSTVPIGTAIDNTRLYVLDRRRRLVPIGVPGELYIGGAGVAHGYLDRDELTAERFLPDRLGGTGRIYRTGDLVRWSEAGELEFLARLDDQVKVRGHRIEPGEIESRLREHETVRDAVVVATERAPGDLRLTAFVIPAVASAEAGVLQTFLRRSLPDYMVPVDFIAVDEFPHTVNNKIDRLALARRGSTARTTKEALLPGVETGLGAIWKQILATGELGRDDNFFDLGGHSLLATRIVSRIRSELGADVSVRDVFERPTIAELGTLIGAARRAVSPDDEPARTDRRSPFELSSSQERMWFLHQLDPDGAAYNLAGAVRLTGPLDIDALQRAVNGVVRRHESLRTTFELRDGVAVQIVTDQYSIDIDRVEYTTVSEGRAGHLDELMAEHARRPFDLRRLPLVRCTVFELSDDDHVLLVCIHHIVSDQWSFDVISREVSAFYDATRSGLRLPASAPTQQADVAARERRMQRDGKLDEHLAYWKQQLADLPSFELPTDRPRPTIRRSDGATIVTPLPDRVVAGITALASTHRVSPFMMLLAALAVLLQRNTGHDDVVVGTPVANRNDVWSESAIGSLVNTLVLRLDLSGEPDVDELVARVRETTLNAFAHQDLPFEQLVAEMSPRRDLGRAPLFQIMLNVQNAPFSLPELDGIHAEFVPVDRRAAQFDLGVSIDLTVSPRVTWEYSTALFDASTIDRLATDYLAVLDEMTSRDRLVAPSPHAPISTRFRSGDEGARRAARSIVGDSAGDPPRPGIETVLADIWRKVLDVDHVGRHDDFFELGGHSLLAVRVFAAIEERTSKRYPITAIFEAPTVAGLGELLQTSGWQPQWSSLVAVQPHGTRQPFFHVSPFLITALSFSELARDLGPDQPLYALQPQGLDDDQPVHRSVAEMAEHYIAEIRTVQPTGPFAIGGHCAGSVVALEITRQLQAVGEQVNVLVLVDSEPPHVDPPRVRRIRHLASRVAHYLSVGRLGDAVRWRVGMIVQQLLIRRAGPARQRKAATVRRIHAEAHARYPGAVVEGDAVLIRSEEWAGFADKAWQLAWSDLLTGDLEVRVVPGSHAALVEREASEAIASHIRAAIDDSHSD